MVSRKALFTGVLYGHDGWSEYWEGTLKRDNHNVGTLTTSSVTWMANYGLPSRINLIAMLPFTLDPRERRNAAVPEAACRDPTLAAKGRLFDERRIHACFAGRVLRAAGEP